MTHSGILRSKSLLKCELLDLCSIVKSDKGAHSLLPDLYDANHDGGNKRSENFTFWNTDCNNSQNDHPITDQACAKTIQTAYNALGVVSKHGVRFDPCTGVVACKMQEVNPQYDLKMIRNWNLEAILEEIDVLMKTKITLTSLHNHVRKAKSFRLSPTTNQSMIDLWSTISKASYTLQTRCNNILQPLNSEDPAPPALATTTTSPHHMKLYK
eukprot:jgi/Psemu1/39174/gm1.39174_g